MTIDVSNEGELPFELEMLRDTVRHFVRSEVAPVEAKLSLDQAKLDPDQQAALQARARELGLWALATPKRLGGAGLDVLAQTIVAEEAAKCRLGAFFPAAGAIGGDPPSVLFHGTAEQFETYGRPIVEGRMPKAFTAISEASGGSDPARAIQLRAERDGDYYVLNGTKTWITHADRAHWGVVYARTGEPGRRDGISCFIVEIGTPGFTRSRIPVMIANSPNELHFDNARVPVANRIGEEGGGFALADDFLTRGRITYGAGPLGIAEEALRLTIEWAKERRVFGGLLAEKQGPQWMLADCRLALDAARLLIHRAARKVDRGEPARAEAAMAKWSATEAAFKTLDTCIQLFGGMGVSCELPLERWFRELRIKRLGEGATEIQRMIVARSLFS
ncbi:acyl-CoA dehydrogenase family protein [Sphingopyxis sp. 113P3]|uniref:acyl-CoA dehydrogenase family protein n=1 Tax=Sphingopyxis sp. (strain 113P3) TaxID=292913 RepID=UPI0006AD125E|nr:acyl-CoA dehydrogenase family protein [Sphingopyxis sp. 113P3]ALC14171.1 butyryl-CoA dehydrogenase [Sphingopyxis sp. 113P3]